MIITHCRSCLSSSLTRVFSLGDLYLSEFTTLQSKRKPKHAPLTLMFCQNCTLLQLSETVPPEYLYTDNYGYRSGINSTMRGELEDITKKTQEIVSLNVGDIVVDVGCNDKTLLSFYQKKGIDKVGFDPIRKFSKYFTEKNEIFINTYFSSKAYSKYVPKRKAKIVTAIAMFYDLDDPNTFLSDVKKVLDTKGIFVIQQNYLVGSLRLNAFDNIVHEHLTYFSLLSLEALLERHDLQVIDVEERSINGGSFRTFVTHKKGPFRISDRVKQMRQKEKRYYLDNKKTYSDFFKRISKNCRELREFLRREVRKGKKVFVYGASTRGNTLLQYARLDNRLILAALERNQDKWGRKIASVDIPIISEEEGRKKKPDYMLVLPWFFKDEFVKRERKYLENGGALIFPLPKMTIVKSTHA